jgi:hypothetical protein
MISDVDDELVALFKQHPKTTVLLALGAPRRTVYAPWLNPPHPLVAETVSPEQIKRLQDRLAGTTPQALAAAGQAWDLLARGIVRLNAAGVRSASGPTAAAVGRQFIGWTMHTEMENMVAADMTPAEHGGHADVRGGCQLDDLGLVAAGKARTVVLDATRWTTSRIRDQSRGVSARRRGGRGEAEGEMDRRRDRELI